MKKTESPTVFSLSRVLGRIIAVGMMLVRMFHTLSGGTCCETDFSRWSRVSSRTVGTPIRQVGIPSVTLPVSLSRFLNTKAAEIAGLNLSPPPVCATSAPFEGESDEVL